MLTTLLPAQEHQRLALIHARNPLGITLANDVTPDFHARRHFLVFD